jgi:uncharacterized protein
MSALNDTDDIGSNQSNTPHLADLIAERLQRRNLLQGGVAVAATTFLGGCAFDGEQESLGESSDALRGCGPLLGFAEVPPSTEDTLTVPDGYTWDVLIPWGTPLFKHSPAFQEDGSNTAADQELQVGFNHDGMHYFPLSHGHGANRHGLLVLNHEYTDASQIYSAAQGSTITPDAAGKAKVAKALAGHGVTVVEIEQNRRGEWGHVQGAKLNRRITGTTPMAFSGPVSASHPLLASSITKEPLGTLNNCAHGYTPWGTYLACEENWNGYFGTADATWTRSALEARYGVAAAGFGYNWHLAEPRFDVAVNRNELNHFGWVVEIDPFDRKAKPVKRTALGRIKHEGATVIEDRGRVIVYSGDDENGEYCYKFVGNQSWRKLRALGKSPLDHGTLYVAKFSADGSGEWLPLVHGQGVLTVANGWSDQADVLIRTRMAADAVAATRLHRPEWLAANAKTGEVYVTLTNGSGNAAAANGGRDPNPYGHIIRFVENKHSDSSFSWEIFLLAGDPTYDGHVPAEQSIFGSPDGVWVDDDGRVWVQTDISNSAQNLASRGYDRIGNNQMLVANPVTREVRRFLVGPRGCEITGVTTTPDQRTMFINVQHPGESTSFWNAQFGAPTTANPSSVSSWPFGGRPRPATVVIRKLDGGKIGT